MISPTQRPLPANTQLSQRTDIHAASEIQTHNPSKRAATDPRLRQRGKWYKQVSVTDRIITFCGENTGFCNVKSIFYFYNCALGVRGGAVGRDTVELQP
jgi:hypothetical protein